MKRFMVIIVVVGLLAFLSVGCNNGGKSADEDKASVPETTLSNENIYYNPQINPTDFSTTVDNEYLPLTPGTTLLYEGDTGEGSEHIEVVVTSKTEEILGVACVEVRDTVTFDGERVEETLDWYAQDKDGNVWYFGEDSKEYEKGKTVSTKGSWEAGVNGALPGIIMQAKPEIGEEYRQEYYKGEAEDMAKVVSLDESVSVATGTYDKCLKIYEWSPLEPNLKEYKYYAPGIGTVLETVAEDETKKIGLIKIRKRQL